MKRINNFTKFLTFALLFSIGILVGLYKFLPFFLQKSVYFCQQFIQAFSIHIPYQVRLLIPALGGVLLIIVLYRLAFVFFQLKHLRKTLHADRTVSNKLHTLLDKLNLQNKVYIVRGEKPFAFCLGIRHPKIYLSTALLTLMTKKELEAILLHERYHLRNRDSMTMLLVSLTRLLFPFFPIVSDWLVEYKITREIEADQEAVQELRGTTPIISVLKKLLSSPTPGFVTLSAIADYDTLEPRIAALTRQKQTRKAKLTNILLSFVSIIFLSGVIIVPVKAVTIMPTNHMQDTTMICLGGEACASWCKEHNTVVPYSNSENVSHVYTPTN